MVMCGGPPRRSRPICAETVSVTSAGRAPRERDGYAGSICDVLLHKVEGREGAWRSSGRTHTRLKPDSADATTSAKRAPSPLECV